MLRLTSSRSSSFVQTKSTLIRASGHLHTYSPSTMPYMETPLASPDQNDKSKPKKLVLCFDGTGNTFSGSTSDTNIVKLYNKFDRDTPDQFHYYQSKCATYTIICNVFSLNYPSWHWDLRHRRWLCKQRLFWENTQQYLANH